MNDLELLQKWSDIAGIPTVSEWRDLRGYFTNFSASDDRLAKVFEGLPGGEAVLERTRRCLGACRQGGSHLYLVPHGNKVPEHELLALFKAHFESVVRIASYMKNDTLVDLLGRLTFERVPEESVLEQYMFDVDSPRAQMSSMVGDFVGNLDHLDTQIILLREAFYTMANNVHLQSYLLWPIYEGACDIQDPFRAYFDLWSCGTAFIVTDEAICLYFAKVV